MEPEQLQRAASRPFLRAATLACLGAVLALAGTGAAEGPAALPIELQVELPPGVDAGAGLTALAGEAELQLVDAGRAGGSWRVVLMFDQLLAEPLVLRNGAVMLAERAAALTALGPVEIVLAGEEVRTSLPATTSAAALDEALAWIRVRESSRHLQAERRREFAERSRPTAVAAETAAAAEREELGAHFDRLLAWAAAAAGDGPQLLLYVGGGYEADPAAFYADALRAADAGASLPALPALSPGGELGQALSMLGWTVVAFQPPARGDTLVAGAEESEAQRGERRFEQERGLSQVAIGGDPRKLGRRQRREISVLADPAAPLVELARQSGGELLVDPLALEDAAERLAGRRRLRGELAPAPSGPLAIRLAAAGAGARGAGRWIGPRPPLAVSAARARRLLREELAEGELWIEAVLEPAAGDKPELTLRIEAEQPAGELRLTLALPEAAGAARVVHQAIAATPGTDDELRLPLPPPVAELGDRPLAVLVEEIAAGRYGATFASVRTAWAPSPAAAPLVEAAAGRVVRLLPPESAMVMGPTVFRTVVDEQAVTRMEFYLDGELAGERLDPPFSARLDLGPLPRTRRVLAVAFGAGGAEVGRDSLLVNGGGGLLEVRIARPRPPDTGSADSPLAGPIDVEAEVAVPEGARLDRVEFFWRGRLVATRYAPPFRERIEVAPGSPRGFVRVVARLADGASSEDVVFLNSPGPSERLDVELIELYVVVTDGAGRPVTGLPRERFRLLEERRPMQIATFGDAGELPLTIGLAIDSSASMFVKLPRVQQAARQFVRGLEPRRDRAFVVGFGSQPLLARNATTDLPQVVQALDRLRPDGQTAIWEAVAFSLVQLQGVPGKKALIVYTDGADEDPEFSYRTCLRFARTVGAPVYFILSNNEIVRTGGKGLSVRGFLGRARELTEEVGGRVFLTRVGADLDAVYREIAEELRSQYLLGYYSEHGDGQTWRSLQVDVKGAGLSARTISGFYR